MGEILRRVGLAVLRFGLRIAGALLCAGGRLTARAGQTLQRLSEHPNLKPPPFFV